LKVLVTGATGLVGSWVARELASRGHEVRVLVRAGSRLDNLEDVSAERLVGDVTDLASVERAVASCEAVVHAAGLARMRSRDMERLLAVNLGGTVNVLGAALRARVRRAIFVGSAGALGGTWRPIPMDEGFAGTAEGCGVDYFVSKHRAELAARELGRAGLPLVVLRPGVALGPGDVYHSSAGIVLQLARGAIPAYVRGGGSYCDVRDVASAHAEALEKWRPGESYVLGGHNLELGELARTVSRLSGSRMPRWLPFPVMMAGALVREVFARLRGRRATVSRQLVRAARRYTHLDSTKAGRELGYATRPIDETLQDTLRWFLQHGDLEASTPELKALQEGLGETRSG
jgi:dihydroflavonol-4-reductase